MQTNKNNKRKKQYLATHFKKDINEEIMKQYQEHRSKGSGMSLAAQYPQMERMISSDPELSDRQYDAIVSTFREQNPNAPVRASSRQESLIDDNIGSPNFDTHAYLDALENKQRSRY